MSGQKLTRSHLKETCYREAGHVVVSRVLGGRVHLVRAGDGSVNDLNSETRRDPVRNLADVLVVSFAGLEAQFTLLEGRTPTCEDRAQHGGGDEATIVHLARILVAEGGEAEDILITAVRRARTLVLDHANEIHKVARALFRRGELTAKDLDALLGPMTLDHGVDSSEFIEMLKSRGVPIRVVN